MLCALGRAVCALLPISACLISGVGSASLSINPAEDLIFKQQSDPDFVVGELVTTDYVPNATTTSLTGNCRYCVELRDLLNGTSVIHPKPDSWRACYDNAVSKSSPVNAPLRLQFCQAEFLLSGEDYTEVVKRMISVNQAPVITESSEQIVEIEENVNSTFVFSLRITDPDQYNVSYSGRRMLMKSCIDHPERECHWTTYRGNVAPCPNHVCTYGGTDVFDVTLNLTSPMDYETERIHTILLEIVDAYTLNNPEVQNSVWQTVTVRVLDVQDMPPFWTSIPPSPVVDEYCAPGTEVFAVKAIDGDLGVKYPSNITYSLEQMTGGEATNQSALTITTVNGTGIISVARSFPIEEFADSDGYIIVNLTAKEVETNQTSVPLILKVLVRDIDNNPPLLYIVENGVLPVLTNTFHARIEENALIRTPIELVLPGSQIVVQDDDMGENAKFLIAISPNDTFEVSPTQGQGYASLTIRVKDNSLLDAEIRQTIHLTMSVWGVTALAEERGPTITTIVIDITDMNDEASFVQYSDSEGQRSICNSSSFPVEVNETFYQQQPRPLLDMYLNGTNIVDADWDIVNRADVSFRDRSFDQPSFAVTSGGVLQVVGPLDYETAPDHMHAVAFIVENRGRNGVLMTSECTVNVTLIDINDELPTITTESNFAIDENLEGLLGIVLANDLDATANLAFSITVDRAESPNGVSLPNPGSFGAHFAFMVEDLAEGQHPGNRSASIRVVIPLDREETQTIYATIAVTDENGDEGLSNYPQTVRKQIVLSVRDVNDNPPQLRYGDEEVGRAFTMDFPELSSRPIVRDFVVTDPDSKPSPPNFQPRVEGFSDPPYANHVSVVRIDANKIRLTIVQAFDYDLIQQLNFTLVVHDDDPDHPSVEPVLNTATTIILNIQNVNNHGPIITSPDDDRLFEINESDGRVYSTSNPGNFAPVNTDIQVTATDQDFPDFFPLKYLMSFKQSPELTSKLRMDEWSGQVTVVEPIDREEAGYDKTFILLLQVIDNADETFNYQTSETRQIRAKIRDVNDNEPIFPNGTEATSIALLPKDNRIGYELPFRHQAKDLDEAETCGKLVYSLVSSASSDSLEINSATGVLKIKSQLTGNTLNFEVEVFDGSVAPQCAPGHRVQHGMFIKILGTEEVHQLRVGIEMDDQAQKQAELDAINAKMEEIGRRNGYIYLFRALSDPKSRSPRVKREKRDQVLDYSYVNATYDPVPIEQINKMLLAYEEELVAVGVGLIGAPNPKPEGKSEGLDSKWIVIGVLVGLLVVAVITAGILVAEKLKLNRKLHAYKSSAGVETAADLSSTNNDGSNNTFSPYTSGSQLRTNPILARFGNVDARFPTMEEGDDFEAVDGIVFPDGIQSESSADDAAATGVEDFEAVLASTNRENLQKQLRANR
ncbi:hypothetical protein RvY_01549 [Ramazzottius varieornatus]|uniref:Cadherin domain-containing protein n=1 Tax=Ramazzottius varieornatus TaxID=947166 RepID=A0A1D1UK67_RAMVA|nr:hypothetical protein RvY_01549 [Ramazzottius varieornatus]